ncbi:MAG: aminoglycoside phosphotransferase family protein [bacterium]
MNSVITFLSENWQRLELQRFGGAPDLSSLIVTPRFKASSHLIFFILTKTETEPILVVKVPRIPGDNRRLQREAENLRWIQSTRSDGFDSIPKVIAFEDYAKNRFLVETAVTYETMRPGVVRRRPEICINAILDWLIDLQNSTRTKRDFSEVKHRRELVLRPLQYFEQTFPCSSVEKDLVADTKQIVMSLLEETWPFVCEHGDLSSPNILMGQEDKIGVVDWELAEPRGVPATDLFFFLTYIAFARKNARKNEDYLAAFHKAYFEESPWTAPYIKRYREKISISEKILKPLFVLCWSRYVASLVGRLKTYEDEEGKLSKQTADWVRSNRYYALWNYAVENNGALALAS